MATKATPEHTLISLSGRWLASCSPKRAAMRVDAMRAKEAPINTSQNLRVLDAPESTASWVLSPNSARKITTKVVTTSFQSM